MGALVFAGEQDTLLAGFFSKWFAKIDEDSGAAESRDGHDKNHADISYADFSFSDTRLNISGERLVDVDHFDPRAIGDGGFFNFYYGHGETPVKRCGRTVSDFMPKILYRQTEVEGGFCYKIDAPNPEI